MTTLLALGLALVPLVGLAATAGPPSRRPQGPAASHRRGPGSLPGGLACRARSIGHGLPGVRAWDRRRRHRRARRQLPEALERIAASLRSGASIATAIADAGDAVAEPLGPSLGELAHNARHGVPLREAVDAWARSTEPAGEASEVALASAALGLGAEAGGAVARAIDGVADTLRERQELGDELRVLSTQARSSAALIAASPVAFAAVVATADSRTLDFLIGSPLGLACVVGGLGLEALGAWWMARILRAAA